jgi:HK97 family phage portal protein
VPPPIVQDLSHGTFTNSAQAGLWFVQFCLSHWVRKLEAEASRSLLTSYGRTARFLEFDLSGFLRGDPESRWRSHEIALRNNVLDANEVREIEGWNPRPGGGTVGTPGDAAGAD